MRIVDENNKLITRTRLLIDTSLDMKKLKYDSTTFNEFNWKVEPPQSYEELKRLRAQQLRDKYKYLIVYFSGGSDSITVMNTFLKNNIFVDEVIICTYSDVGDSYSDGKYALDYLIKNNFSGKTTVVDINHNMLEKILYKDLWHNHKTAKPTFYASLLRTNISWFEENNLIKREERPTDGIASIYGSLTPHMCKTGNTYFNLLEPSALMSSSSSEAGGYGSEMFFTSSDFPELHSKQCHILKNYMKVTEEYRDSFLCSFNEAKNPKTRMMIRKLIRDEYNHLVSSPFFFISHIKLSDESTVSFQRDSSIIAEFYEKRSKALSDRYIQSVYKDTNKFVDFGLNLPPYKINLGQ